jgi:ribosomal-protein-alanine N-acetyltransferase
VTVDGLVIRSAAPADLQEVAAIETACFRSDPWPRQSFESFVDRAGVDFLVAEDLRRKGRIAGYAVLIRVADEAELLNLAVADDSRRGGIGSALLEKALGLASGEGVRTIYLEVRESNAAARGLYAAHGFVEVGRRRRYYQRPVEDALILQRVRP